MTFKNNRTWVRFKKGMKVKVKTNKFFISWCFLLVFIQIFRSDSTWWWPRNEGRKKWTEGNFLEYDHFACIIFFAILSRRSSFYTLSLIFCLFFGTNKHIILKIIVISNIFILSVIFLCLTITRWLPSTPDVKKAWCFCFLLAQPLVDAIIVIIDAQTITICHTKKVMGGNIGQQEAASDQQVHGQVSLALTLHFNCLSDVFQSL